MAKPSYEELEKRVQDLEKRLKEFDIKQFWSAYSQSPIPTLIVSKEDEIIKYNSAMAELTGYSHEEVPDIKAMITRIYPDEEYRSKVIEIIRKSRFKEIGIKREEFIITRKDGEKRYVEFSGYNIMHDDKPTGVQIVQGVDITAQKEADVTLQKSVKHYKTVFENAGDAIFIHDIGGRFIEVNQTACDCLGYSREELLRMSPLDIDTSEYAALVPERTKELLGRGLVFFESDHKRKDGSIIPVELSLRIIDYDNKKAVLCIARDITERKKIEKELHNALAKSQRRESEFSALLEGSRAILEYHEFKDATRLIFDLCKKLIGATAGYIALLSEDRTNAELLFVDPGGFPCTADLSVPMPLRGLREEAYRTGKTVFTNDFPTSNYVKYLPEGHMKLDNVLFAPLIIKGKAVGLMGIANKPGGFTENDVRLASAFAEFAAIALYNSRSLELLKNSEEHCRSLSQTANDAIISINRNGEIISWNRGAKTIFGYTEEEIVGKPVILLIPERYRDAHQKGLERLNANGELRIMGKTVEMQGLRKDGSEFPLEISLATWNEGKEHYYSAIIRDITEHNLTEKELKIRNEIAEVYLTKNEAELYNEVLGITLNAVKSKFGLFGYLNEEGAMVCSSLTGEIWDRCQIPDKTIVFPLEKLGGLKRNAIIEKKIMYSNKPFTVPEGHVPVTRAISVPIVYQNEVIGLIVTGNKETDYDKNDINLLKTIAEYSAPLLHLKLSRDREEKERKKAEETLQESERKYRNLYKSSKDGIVYSNMEGNLLDANQAYLEMLGYTLEEIKKLTYQQLTPRKWHTIDEDIVENQIMERGYSEEYEKEYIKKNGTVFPIALRVWLIKDEEEKPKGLWGVIRDITERKRAEEELKKSKEAAEAANRAKSVFLSTMSHELRTPLNSVIGFAQVLNREHYGPLNTKQKEYIHDIVDSGQHLLSLINDILDLSKIEAGKMKLELRNMLISPVIDRSLLFFKERALDHRFKLEFHREENLPAVFADERAVLQVLVNLLSNAAKFTPDSGMIEVKSYKKGDFVAVEVIDTGIGIPPEDQERIFEIFEQVSSTYSKKIEGTGLGLSLVQGLLKDMGGTISVKSEVGKGSKFTFTLPIARE